MTVGEPTQDGSVLVVSNFLGDTDGQRAHRHEIHERQRNRVKRCDERYLERAGVIWIGEPIDLDVDPRLGGSTFAERHERAGFVTHDAQHRRDSEVHDPFVQNKRGEHRIDDERRVLDDQIDCGVRTLPAIIGHCRVVDPNHRRASSSNARQAPVGERNRVQVVDVAHE